ncbi:MAG TPA: hypothetical protein VFN54_04025 [Acidimicrobiales bacterium]|nr:hypothetical protein [Acidimicrobiales bacterium]
MLGRDVDQRHVTELDVIADACATMDERRAIMSIPRIGTVS